MSTRIKLKAAGALLAVAGVIGYIAVGPGNVWPMAMILIGFGLFIAGRLAD